MPDKNILGARVHYRERGSGSQPKVFWILWYSMWIGISILCLLLGVRSYFKEQDFLSGAELDAGTITTYELHVRNDGKSEYCPRIEFTSKSGEPVAVQGGDCPNQPDDSKIGQNAQVYYDPNNPENYEVKSSLTGYDGLIFGSIGAAFFGLFWLVPLVITLVLKLTKGVNPSTNPNAERHRVNQQKAEGERGKKDTESSVDEEFKLAELEEQEQELKKKIEERRRRQGK